MTIASALKTHSCGICLAIGVLVATALSLHMACVPMIPVADGQGYAMRTFALCGFLHTGQWGEFWHLLSRPVQSILPLHDLLFFLLPSGMAGAVSYVALQNFTTYLLLAYAIYKITEALNRTEWAPAIVLLCCVNNVALTDFYAFFLDMNFMALGLLVIAWQMHAWREKRASFSVLAGLGLGLLFWTKPANASLFLATFVLSEIIYLGFTREIKDTLRHGAAVLIGFLPLFGAALLMGAGHTILQLIDHNEIHESGLPVANGGLLWLLYFPLCVSVFYHVALLGGLFIAALLVSQKIPASPETPPSFPIRIFLSLALAYFVFGEFFSFWMLVKPMRALLLVIPFFFIAMCWLGEKYRLRPEALLAVAVLYALAVFSQKEFNSFNTRDQLVEATYQLSPASWTEMPGAWRGEKGFNAAICDSVSSHLSSGGIICVNSLEIWNSLIWQLNNQELLQGKKPGHEVRTLFNYKGDYYDQSLIGARNLVLITSFRAQSNRRIWLQSMALLDYANATWIAGAQVTTLPANRGEPIGYEINLTQALTAADVDTINRSSAFSPTGRIDGNGADSLYGHHYSRDEAWALIRAWIEKRFD
jgi:hypothetical protein